MKKITLMLCACAMAFAGLLVSCNNGSEKIIFTDTTSYDYAYSLSGSIVTTRQTTPTGDKAALVQTVTTTETFASSAIIEYSVNDNTEFDCKNFTLTPSDCKADKVVKTSFSGTSASSQTAVADTFTDYYERSLYTRHFYKLGDKYYNGTAQYSANTTNGVPNSGIFNTYTEDEEKDLSPVVTVTGDIENDDKITIVYTYTEDNATSEDEVDKTVTVYTYNLVKAGTED